MYSVYGFMSNSWLFRLFADAPRITNAPKNMKVAEEMIVSFFCKASGYPAPRFEWHINNKRINPHRKRFKDFNISAMPGGTVLRIFSVKRDMEDSRHGYNPDADTVVTCVAKNEVGEATANATLHIYPLDSK